MTRRTALTLLPVAALAASRTPVLVELFTSEGCSSCPPADQLLVALDHHQPVENAEIVVLSEHVDYWNHIGWKDPMSSSTATSRQRDYCARLRVDGPYTPQMIVDGQAEFVGSDSARARTAIRDAARSPKLEVQAKLDGHRLTLSMPGATASDAEVYVALAQESVTTRVPRGENNGRTLHHVAAVRDLTRAGVARQGTPFTASLDLRPDHLRGVVRIIVFAQERRTGRIIAVRRVVTS
ncbi:MAG: DUF1223 domain-containing protein [Bryobacteraceae bacterium]|nr:DUF1223 domain-containing protein [Bryobacteraceae bacterium]